MELKKQLISARSERQKALNIFISNGDLLDRSFPTPGSNTVSDLKVSFVLVELSPTHISTPIYPLLFEFESYISNTEETWQNGLIDILNLNRFSPFILKNMFLKQEVSIHRVFYVNGLDDVYAYVNKYLQITSY